MVLPITLAHLMTSEEFVLAISKIRPDLSRGTKVCVRLARGR